jgi:hypothetical protein
MQTIEAYYRAIHDLLDRGWRFDPIDPSARCLFKFIDGYRIVIDAQVYLEVKSPTEKKFCLGELKVIDTNEDFTLLDCHKVPVDWILSGQFEADISRNIANYHLQIVKAGAGFC